MANSWKTPSLAALNGRRAVDRSRSTGSLRRSGSRPPWFDGHPALEILRYRRASEAHHPGDRRPAPRPPDSQSTQQRHLRLSQSAPSTSARLHQTCEDGECGVSRKTKEPVRPWAGDAADATAWASSSVMVKKRSSFMIPREVVHDRLEVVDDHLSALGFHAPFQADQDGHARARKIFDLGEVDGKARRWLRLNQLVERIPQCVVTKIIEAGRALERDDQTSDSARVLKNDITRSAPPPLRPYSSCQVRRGSTIPSYRAGCPLCK